MHICVDMWLQFSESNVELFNREYPCLVFLQATRDMHKSGLVLSTPSSQFRDTSLWDSRLLLSIVLRAFPCFVLTSDEGYTLNCVSCFLLMQVVFGYRYCYTVIMRWHYMMSTAIIGYYVNTISS